MGIKVRFKDGIFEPLDEVKGLRPGQIYMVFSDEELVDILQAIGWLKTAESSFELWNNSADAIYDTL
jgi:hypothetical protein